ncbi:MAG: hypothetical protein ABIK81_04255 [candidate division WOR-3 bacterium]
MAKTKSKQKRKRFLTRLKWKRRKKKMKEKALISTPKTESAVNLNVNPILKKEEINSPKTEEEEKENPDI